MLRLRLRLSWRAKGVPWSVFDSTQAQREQDASAVQTGYRLVGILHASFMARAVSAGRRSAEETSIDGPASPNFL